MYSATITALLITLFAATTLANPLPAPQNHNRKIVPDYTGWIGSIDCRTQWKCAKSELVIGRWNGRQNNTEIPEQELRDTCPRIKEFLGKKFGQDSEAVRLFDRMNPHLNCTLAPFKNGTAVCFKDGSFVQMGGD
ncbi:hypothetical protein BJ508DRAFT_344559 [Ascobolus immersus RN42]|uniref:Uncharacterized protein n=1 Tax=Ascobolus immersus RN42 TaxID=1160509 RepID=A0A3N4ICH4_ASCIM|nr:hypothetical protein BJ508DRAFT_344559 [Ascobolus immersus RN42]